MAQGLGRGEVFDWLLDLSARLPEEVETGKVFPLQALDANIVHQNPGPLDALVCGPHSSDGDPTLDVSTHSIVGFLPLYYEVTGYNF